MQLTDHIVPGDALNHQIQIFPTGDIGAGGAHHRYVIYGFNTTANEAREREDLPSEKLVLLFQNGPIGEVGRNGISAEALAAIQIHRLIGFQNGPFGCHDNGIALFHFRQALKSLQDRTRERITRGVEGTHQK